MCYGRFYLARACKRESTGVCLPHQEPHTNLLKNRRVYLLRAPRMQFVSVWIKEPAKFKEPALFPSGSKVSRSVNGIVTAPLWSYDKQ